MVDASTVRGRIDRGSGAAKVLTAAVSLIIERGYAATTIKDIAEAAGVSVNTIHYHFGEKGAILARLLEVDEADLTVECELWALDVASAPTAEEHLRRHVVHVGQSYRRRGFLLAAAQAAASDPKVTGTWSTVQDSIAGINTKLAMALKDKVGYRREISPARARDTIETLLDVAVFDDLVRRRGWSPDEWEEFVGDLIVHRLVRACPPSASTSGLARRSGAEGE